MSPAEIEKVIQTQLDAYNAHDIEAFMAMWADDALYFEHPSTLLAEGAAAIRARHVARFQEANLFARLKQRMVLGNKVVDYETVTRTFPEGPGTIDVIVTYEVINGKVAKAWYIFGTPVLDAV
ncbi:MAG: nuclear transport factor 2 family protein [Pseudomonadota bacterium]